MTIDVGCDIVLMLLVGVVGRITATWRAVTVKSRSSFFPLLDDLVPACDYNCSKEGGPKITP